MAAQGRGFPRSLLFLGNSSLTYLWLCWVFVCHERALCRFSERGLRSGFRVRASLVADTGLGLWASEVVAHGL